MGDRNLLSNNKLLPENNYYCRELHRDRDLKSCQSIDSDKNNLMRKFDFLLKGGFQVLIFFILLEVGYLIKIVVYFVYK